MRKLKKVIRADPEMVPRPPKWMSAEGKRIWKRCASTLFVSKKLEPHHRVWFEMFCSIYGRQEKIRADTAKAQNDQARAVLEAVQKDNLELLEQLFEDLGFGSQADFEEFLRKSVN